MCCSFKCFIHYFSANKKVYDSLPSHDLLVQGYALCVFSDQGKKKKRKEKNLILFIYSVETADLQQKMQALALTQACFLPYSTRRCQF